MNKKQKDELIRQKDELIRQEQEKEKQRRANQKAVKRPSPVVVIPEPPDDIKLTMTMEQWAWYFESTADNCWGRRDILEEEEE